MTSVYIKGSGGSQIAAEAGSLHSAFPSWKNKITKCLSISFIYGPQRSPAALASQCICSISVLIHFSFCHESRLNKTLPLIILIPCKWPNSQGGPRPLCPLCLLPCHPHYSFNTTASLYVDVSGETVITWSSMHSGSPVINHSLLKTLKCFLTRDFCFQNKAGTSLEESLHQLTKELATWRSLIGTTTII